MRHCETDKYFRRRFTLMSADLGTVEELKRDRVQITNFFICVYSAKIWGKLVFQSLFAHCQIFNQICLDLETAPGGLRDFNKSLR